MLPRCEHAKCCVNAWIVPFLIFGVEEGNGHTALATSTFHKPEGLSDFVVNYFNPSPKHNVDLSSADVNESDDGS
jgi:hypothetical protein